MNGFAQLLHAEWTKFRTVRGWVVGTVVAGLLIVALGFLTANNSHSETCINGSCATSKPSVPTGPGGEAVTDSFTFAHRSLTADGSITARVTSLTGRYSPTGAVPVGAGGATGLHSGVQPWTKAGVIVKASTAPGSAYAAVLVTGGHGVRMQYDYTHDIAGLPGAVSASAPRWLRLDRSGDTLTGYDSPDGVHWTPVGTARLAGLPRTVQIGLFATSPDYTVEQTHFGSGHGSGGPSWATARFDHVDAPGNASWQHTVVAGDGGPHMQMGVGVTQTADTVTVSGSGDIAPAVGGQGGGDGVERTLIGAFAALIAIIVLGTLFVTGEYRRGLIRTTFAASPSRGRVLAAKAVVLGAVTFVAGLVACAITVPLAEHVLRGNGNTIYPVGTLTDVQVVVGTAALLAVAAVLALAVGTALRRGAGAVTLAIAAIVLPYILATASVLPTAPARWLLRLTPAAGFAIQQSLVQYPQVNADYSPANGYFPLPPWGGFLVLCAWAALALGLATVLLRRRDA